ncbi:methyltransferase family protein [Thermodesulfobacteriota bacterium]
MAHLILILTYLIGTVSMLVLGIFLFWGPLSLVALGLSEISVLGLNTCLSLAFFIQHSTMNRKPFRRWLVKYIHERYHGAFYTIASGIVLLILAISWQQSGQILLALQGVPRLLLRAVFFMSFVGFYLGMRALGSFDSFGVKPILRHLRGVDPPPPTPFTVRGPYRWVRHPLYFFSLILIWSCPDLTADRLLFNVLWTAWIIAGTVLEERDLACDFGEAYRDYQRKVPMLIPWHIYPIRK